MRWSRASKWSTYRSDQNDFISASMRWNLVRWYALLLLISLTLAAICVTWAIQTQSNVQYETGVATATESSRPLGGEDKAPADWTGDGKPDGWLLGEWLPGQTSTIYLVDGEQVSGPMRPADYVALVLMAITGFAGFTVLAFFLIGDWVIDRAHRNAYEDWKQCRLLVSGAQHEGIPLWAR